MTLAIILAGLVLVCLVILAIVSLKEKKHPCYKCRFFQNGNYCWVHMQQKDYEDTCHYFTDETF